MSVRVTILSSLEKIFPGAPLPAPHGRLALLRGERGSLQFVFVSEEDVRLTVNADSPLPCRLFAVQEVPVGLAI